ncbi:hypothetical protein V1521DRAFT_441102 [Lipomyces starkeyi]
MDWRLFITFGPFNMAAFIHVWFRTPEINKFSLEEMDEIFEHEETNWRSFTNGRRTDHLDALASDIEQTRHNRTVREEYKDTRP